MIKSLRRKILKAKLIYAQANKAFITDKFLKAFKNASCPIGNCLGFFTFEMRGGELYD